MNEEEYISQTELYKEMFDQQSQLDLSLDVLESLDMLLETVDTLTPYEIGVRLSKIREMAKDIVDLSTVGNVDRESMELDPITSARVEVESLVEAIGDVLVGLKMSVTSTKKKLMIINKNAYTWSDNNSKKIEEIRKLISTKESSLKSSVNLDKLGNVLGNKLATFRLVNGTLSELKAFSDTITELGDSKSSMNALDRKVLSIVGSNTLDNPNDFIKVIRLDRKRLCFIVITMVDGVAGFKAYVDTSLSMLQMAKVNKYRVDKKMFTLDYANELLSTAEYINSKIVKKSDMFIESIKSTEDSLKGDIDNAKYKAGPIFNLSGKEVLFYAAGTAAVVVGSTMMALSLPATVSIAVLKAGRIILTGVKTLGRGIKAIAATKAAKGVGLAVGGAGAMYGKDSVIKHKDIVFEKLDARSKIKVLTKRIRLTSKTAVDGVYGLDGVVSDLITTARIIASMHNSK